MAASRSLWAGPRCVSRRCGPRASRSLLRRASSAASEEDMYDVVCVGGGPAGLSLLTALRSNPVTSRLRLALVEAQDLARTAAFAPPPAHFSNRCSSLTPASARFLDAIGAWAHLRRERLQAYDEMQVWDGLSGARIEFDWSHGSGSGSGSGSGRPIAYMVENLNLAASLLRRLGELGGVDVFDGDAVDGIAFGAETEALDLRAWPVVGLASGRALAARLLVGADGANSPVRAFAGIESRGWDYGRHAVVATLELDAAATDAHVAYQRFLPSGPVALLPLPGRHATLTWSTTPERAALLKRLAAPDLAAMVNAAFRLGAADLAYMHTQPAGQHDEFAWRAQHTPVDPDTLPPPVVGVQPGSVASFPLRLRHADTYIGERVALVGDAAHTIHPLAGQGLNQGQADVQSLARAIEHSVTYGQDVGTFMSLESYNSERYAANHILLGVCDKLHRLYSVAGGPLVPLRSLGLRAVNALPALKTFFMDQASGTGFKIL